MTMINTANLHTAVPSWGLDTLSLAVMPEPTLDDLAELDTFDDMLLVDMLLAASPEPALHELSELDMFDDEPLGARATRAAPTATAR